MSNQLLPALLPPSTLNDPQHPRSQTLSELAASIAKFAKLVIQAASLLQQEVLPSRLSQYRRSQRQHSPSNRYCAYNRLTRVFSFRSTDSRQNSCYDDIRPVLLANLGAVYIYT